LSNVGSVDGIAEIHLKNMNCIEDVPGQGNATTKLERIAEEGGKIYGTIVPGVGTDFGSGCEMAKYVGVEIYVAGSPLDLSAYDKNGDGVTELNELDCEQIELANLNADTTLEVKLEFHLQWIDEDDLGLDYFPNGSVFEYWPTHALHGDEVQFDADFILLAAGRCCVEGAFSDTETATVTLQVGVWDVGIPRPSLSLDPGDAETM